MISLVSDVGLHEEVVVPEVAHGTHVLRRLGFRAEGIGFRV